MQEYGFSLTRILPYRDKIYDFVLMWENTGQWKPVFSHILCSVIVIGAHVNIHLAKTTAFVVSMIRMFINKTGTQK